MSQSQVQAVSLKNECFSTLNILTGTLLDLQIKEASDADFGAIRCPGCELLHTRAAEAMYPFFVTYKNSGDKRYLLASIRAGNWLIEQQLQEGQWNETPGEWTGTTADQLLMMALTYPGIHEHLSAEEKQSWKMSMKNAADYLVKYMSPDFAGINYCPTSAAALALTNKIIRNEKYREKAKNLARWTVAKMDEEKFITGEAARVYGVKYGIDLGYEMDMSLWGLALYARICEDTFVLDEVRQSLKKNLYFVYPNGAIDGSWGSRCFKWTTYGSKTADGCQILFSLFAHEDARYRTAALRNLDYLRGMIKDGMIGNGPQYWELHDTVPCNYPTFARAKNLAMAVELGEQKEGNVPPLPSDQHSWLKIYPTVDVAVARSKNMMVTVSAYGYKDVTNWGEGRYSQHPGGGSICNLWVKDHGFLQTSSQTRYVRGEAMHMPVVDDTVICLTPRIEFTNKNGYFTNLYECEAQFSANSEDRTVAIISTSGELKDEKYYPGGIAYIWKHALFDDAIEKTVTLRFHDCNSEVRVVEPVVLLPGMHFELMDSKTVMIQGSKRNFKLEIIEGNAEIELGKDAERYWFPFPSMRTYPVVLKVHKPDREYIQKVLYRISM